MSEKFVHILIKRESGCLDEEKNSDVCIGLLVYFRNVYGAVREISVSNTVNGRELPIYSVETEAKQVALSLMQHGEMNI